MMRMKKKKKESINEGNNNNISNNNNNNNNNNIDNQIIQRRSKEKEKGISAQNMVLLRTERNKKNRVRRKSQFVEQLQFDFNDLRNKFRCSFFSFFLLFCFLKRIKF